MTYSQKQIIKFLRDELVQAIDQLGINVIEHGSPSGADLDLMDAKLRTFRDCVVNRSITLDTLHDLAEHEPPDRPAGRRQR